MLESGPSRWKLPEGCPVLTWAGRCNRQLLEGMIKPLSQESELVGAKQTKAEFLLMFPVVVIAREASAVTSFPVPSMTGEHVECGVVRAYGNETRPEARR